MTVKPNLNNTEVSVENVNKIFQRKGRVYVGVYEQGVREAIADQMALDSLISGSTQKFVRIGKGSESIGKVEYKGKTTAVDFGKILTGYDVSASFEKIDKDPEFLAWSATDEAKGLLSVLFVTSDKKKFVLLEGVYMGIDGAFNFDGKTLSKDTLNFTADGVDHFLDVLNYGLL